MATNPFTPSFGHLPPLLVGRAEALDESVQALDGGPGGPGRTTLVTGLRGMGKTVMLEAFEDEARQRGWLTVYQCLRSRRKDMHLDVRQTRCEIWNTTPRSGGDRRGHWCLSRSGSPLGGLFRFGCRRTNGASSTASRTEGLARVAHGKCERCHANCCNCPWILSGMGCVYPLR